ncbi:alanine--tRNA ligase [Chloroflexota bacterium]
MTSDGIRAAYLSFFAEKGHKIIPSSSLITQDDPTLLLTSAGMVPFKPYFLGEAVPPARRLVSCQKCFRTTDIEVVGSPTHLTFFEMLGNFSVGNYFKREAIDWAWEFVTRHLALPQERLWVTVFTDDDESFRIWRQLGVPDSRMLRLGEEDNFWGPAGDSGPCGPCSEIHYDFGEEFGCRQPSCDPGCKCGRFSELWNLVFTQYNQDKNGCRTPLPKPNIDTGMGLERATAAVQGKNSVYGTDLFVPLLESISGLAGKRYGTDDGADNSLRIIAEHSRGIAFLIADGVVPASDGRGYVLRHLLRRAVVMGRKLGLTGAFLVETAGVTIRQMGPVYPELVQKRGFILAVIEAEEKRFGGTLSTGLEMLDNVIAKAGGKDKKITGQQAFKLYDTYGFPVELTEEIAAERGFSVDLSGFAAEMANQRERARNAHKFELAEKAGWQKELDLETTPFVGYRNLKQETAIIGLLVDGDCVDAVAEGQEAGLILETTPFYAEMGGQVGDTGEIIGPSDRFAVTGAVRVPPDIVVHQGRVTEGKLTVGDKVAAAVDEERRRDVARNHTATHLLQFALRQVLGEHVEQRGSLVTPEQFRFDFSHLEALTGEQLAAVERLVNRKIRQNLAVSDREIPYQQAVAEGALALFGEKYSDTVRVITVGEPAISTELCGGTHVTATGEIGFLYITGESSIGAGLRRIEVVTGRGAESYVSKMTASRCEIARLLDAEPEGIAEKVRGLVAELDKERKRSLALEMELAGQTAESLVNQTEAVNGVTVLAARVSSLRPEALREMGDRLRDKLESAVIVLGTVYEGRPSFLTVVTADLVSRGYHAGEIIKKVAGVTSGGGGGKATFAQAGGRDKDKLDEALRLVKSLI